jgi:hypothetical protein
MHRELAKAAVEEAAWSEVDLANRIEKFTPLIDSSLTRTARSLSYLSYLHRNFGPNYHKYWQWNLDHPILVIPPVLGVVYLLCRRH